jgi:hypothetical protein
VRSARTRPCVRHITSLAVCFAALILSGTPSSAATVSNRDDKEHKLTIIEGEAKSEQALKPQQVLEKVCLKSCIVRLNDSEDDEYQLDPEDIVSIEDGYLYHDAPEAPAAPAPGVQPNTPAPKT